jgi:signal transduction histidine kinase/CheY-like chemotaxis protein
MKLQIKTSLTLVVSLATLAVIVGYFFSLLIVAQFRQLEEDQALTNAHRVEAAMQQEVRLLIERAKDWAMWDESYQFINETNTTFIDENLSFEAVRYLNFSHLIFLNSRGEIVISREINPRTESAEPLQVDAVQQLVIPEIVKRGLSDRRGVTGGFARVGEHNYIVAAYPITDSAGESEPRGVFFVTREVSDELPKTLSQVTRLDVEVDRKFEQIESPEKAPLTDFSSAFSYSHVEKTEDTLSITSTVHSLRGEPLFTLKAGFPRGAYKRAIEATRLFFWLMGLGCVLVGLLANELIRRLVVRPVSTLVEYLHEITSTSHFAGRVEIASRDEIGTLAAQINETLQALQVALGSAEKAQHHAEAANAAKSSFIAKVSHELRTPIHSITGMLRILLKEERSSAKRNYIMMARNSAYGLLETINEILDFSKAEAGRLVFERVEFSLHEVIREAIQTIGPRVEEKGSLEVLVQVPQGIPETLLGDPLRLRQVLVNLLGNATKFTKEGHVGVSVTIQNATPNRVLLEVTVFDTGIGIPADRLDHIFEPFGQADESVSRMFTGTGLGLTIVKQFVDGMGGSVRVESEIGVGSQFILSLPCTTVSGASPVVFRPTLSSPRVALLDGDSVVVEGFCRELRDNGYFPEIVRCQDPRELNRLSHSIDQYGLVIVTSEALKRSRVFDLVVELRGRESVPVVSILSPFEISVRERLLALEVPYVVTRPISLLDILGVVSGGISLKDEGWDDSEDTSLQAERSLEILVADDASTNRIILTELLRDAGHHVVCVENGVDMVSRVREFLEGAAGAPRFDLILTDVQMPLLDGLNATAQIRVLEQEKGGSFRVPIVAVTAHAMTDEVSRMRNFGVDDVVTKPLDPMRLGAVIQRLTGQASPSTKNPPKLPSAVSLDDNGLLEIALRIWTQLTKRDASVAQLFALSEDPSKPEEFQRVLDVIDVFERSGNSVRRTLLIFRCFLDSFREQLQRLAEAKQSNCAEDLRFASHALKGLLLDVGARVSGELASSIEHMCAKGDEERGGRVVSQLTKQVLLISRIISQIHAIASGEGSESAEAPLS